MTISDLTALFGLLLSGAVFVLLASRVKTTEFNLFGFTLANQQIDKKKFGSSFVAASTSLATVILFFLSSAEIYGITLLWCGATYLLGQYLFLKLVVKKNKISSDIRTTADLWFHTIRSKANALWITYLTFLSFLIILFIELYIGSVILSYFFNEFTSYAKVIAFFTLGIIVIFYVRIGGLNAVMQTDRWQLKMLLLAVFALILFSFLAPVATHSNILEIKAIFDFQSSWYGVILFWVWILVLNLALPFTQLSSWQRVAACSSLQEAMNGFKSHIISFLIVWIIPVIAFVILNVKGYDIKFLNELFDSIKSLKGVSEGILYPLVVIGFGSALFSTADTALIALITSLSDENTFRKRIEKLSPTNLKSYLTLFSFLIMALLTVIFTIAEADLGSWFMPLIYNIFGQLAILAPLMIFALWNLEKEPIKLSWKGNFILSASILIAWLCIIGSTVVSVKLGNQLWSQIAAPVGMIVTSLGLYLSLLFKKSMW